MSLRLVCCDSAIAMVSEFEQADQARWQQEYATVVDEGEALFHGGLKNRNTVSCDQCYPNAANTHPATDEHGYGCNTVGTRRVFFSVAVYKGGKIVQEKIGKGMSE